jgi:3-oxoacyl-[acyl-carrier protein] reductase
MRRRKLPTRRLGFDLDGKVALVTGGSRGIGAATAELLAQAGASVVVNFRTRQTDATRVVRRIVKARGRATAIGADISDPRQAQALVEETVDLYAGIDILVNNASIWEDGPLLKMTVADWARTMATNLDAVFFTTQAAARHMKRAKSGSIVNISSTAGQRGEAEHSHYAASKAGVIALTKSWAAELARYGIRVNCVAPGWVDTEMAAPGLVGTAKREVLRSIPMRRIGEPGEIAAAILFLAGDACGFANGEILNVNGGAVLCG